MTSSPKIFIFFFKWAALPINFIKELKDCILNQRLLGCLLSFLYTKLIRTHCYLFRVRIIHRTKPPFQLWQRFGTPSMSSWNSPLRTNLTIITYNIFSVKFEVCARRRCRKEYLTCNDYYRLFVILLVLYTSGAGYTPRRFLWKTNSLNCAGWPYHSSSSSSSLLQFACRHKKKRHESRKLLASVGRGPFLDYSSC